jgi:hypothetical protein
MTRIKESESGLTKGECGLEERIRRETAALSWYYMLYTGA